MRSQQGKKGHKKFPSERIPSVTSASRGQMQIGFLSNCTHTLIVWWSAGVRMKCRNTSSLATRLIQMRSFKTVFVALITNCWTEKPSTSVTFSSPTSIISLVTQLSFQVPFNGVDMHVYIIGIPTQMSSWCLLLGRFSNRCCMLCHNFCVLVLQTTGCHK